MQKWDTGKLVQIPWLRTPQGLFAVRIHTWEDRTSLFSIIHLVWTVEKVALLSEKV